MLRFDIRRSPLLALLLALLHCGALALALTVPMPAWGHILVGLLIAASAAHAILLHAWQTLGRSIVGLEVSEDCKVTILDRSGGTHERELMPSSFIAPYLTVLNLRRAGGWRPRTLILVPDRVAPDVYRRLRVLLRWRCRDGAPDEKVVL
jgi:toxin CptA